jgi:hypothetical protein
MSWSEEDKEIARALVGIVKLPHQQRKAAILLMGGKDIHNVSMSQVGVREAWAMDCFQDIVMLWCQHKSWIIHLGLGPGTRSGRICDV